MIRLAQSRLEAENACKNYLDHKQTSKQDIQNLCNQIIQSCQNYIAACKEYLTSKTDHTQELTESINCATECIQACDQRYEELEAGMFEASHSDHRTRTILKTFIEACQKQELFTQK